MDTKEDNQPGVKAIFGAINAIQRKVPAIGKDSRNTKQNFNFRGIDAVYNTLKPLLAEYGVFTVPEVVELRREERQTQSGGVLAFVSLTMRYRFTSAEDGSEVVACVVGEGMDSGDKATNKAMSIAHKYALFQIFCIPTEDIIDPDAETPEPIQPRGPATRATAPAAPAASKPAAGPAEPAKPASPWDAIVPCGGKQKGMRLRDLDDASIYWWADEWTGASTKNAPEEYLAFKIAAQACADEIEARAKPQPTGGNAK